MEKNTTLLVCAAKVRVLKLQDIDYKGDADNQIPHVLNMQHIWRISRPRKRLHVLGWTEVSNSLCNMWTLAPGMPWRKGTTSRRNTSKMYLLQLRLAATLLRWKKKKTQLELILTHSTTKNALSEIIFNFYCKSVENIKSTTYAHVHWRQKSNKAFYTIQIFEQ